MSSRASATLKDVRPPTVSDALRRNLRPAILVGVFVGAATFAALSMLAPGQAGAAQLAPGMKAGLSALMGLAALMFAAASIVMVALFGGAGTRRSSKKVAASKKRKDPLLTELPAEPQLSERPEVRSTAQSEAAIERPTLSLPDSPGNAVQAPSTIFDEIGTLAARIATHRSSGVGHRTLITSEGEPIVPFDEALELARALADGGAQTILIDWSPSGNGFARAAGLQRKAGWNDLLSRSARFDDIIQRLPGSRVHVIASGSAVPGVRAEFDANFLNLALDALDEAYDQIIVVGRHDEARALFECIEGRFDTGITVVSQEEGGTVQDHNGAFLGFEVAEIDVLQYRRPEQAPSQFANRIAHATRSREPAAQSG